MGRRRKADGCSLALAEHREAFAQVLGNAPRRARDSQMEFKRARSEHLLLGEVFDRRNV